MLMSATIARRQRGTTMMEVLITLLILSFGMLGLAGLEMKMQLAGMESYQRAQAVVLLSDMLERINANRANANTYATTLPLTLGTPDTSQPASCASLAMGPLRDRCEWSYALQGAAETTGASNVGAMIGARGCIQQIQAPNPASPACRPGVYRVTVAWQGLNPTVAPTLVCGAGSYGSNAALGRAISANVTVGLTGC